MPQLRVPAPTGPLHEDPVVYRRRWFLLGIMCLSLVMVVMSVAGLNVALPSLQRDLARAPAPSSGSSTPTPWCSPPSSSPPAPWATASDGSGP